VGKASGCDAAVELEFRSPSGIAKVTQAIPKPHRGSQSFVLAPPADPDSDFSVFATINGVPLLGSGLQISPNFNLNGQTVARRGRLTGWARLGWQPKQRLILTVADELGSRYRFKADTPSSAHSGFDFELSLRDTGLVGERLTVSALLPDGTFEALPDAPLCIRKPAARKARYRPSISQALTRRGTTVRPGSRQNDHIVDIIVPVYAGHDETAACLASVLKTTSKNIEIIVVDDASPDHALAAHLRQLAAFGRISLVRNPENLGFVGSVNHGLGIHPWRDAILLNSDTLVFGDWCDRLRAAAYAAPDIGTVTPLTNHGSIVSYPSTNDHHFSCETAAAIDQFVAMRFDGTHIELPVGVGFCLYLRRDCLVDTGSFDQELFSKGYGEETDYCMRARQNGWRHVLAPNVFVRHDGAVSFGKRREALLDRGERMMKLVHPNFSAVVSKFLAVDSIRPVRRIIDEWRVEKSGKPYALIVTHALAGGVAKFVRDHGNELRGQGLEPLILRPTGAATADCRLMVGDPSIIDLVYELPGDFRALRSLLKRLNIRHIEIHHFLGLQSRVIEMVRGLGRPYDVYVHDFIWFCPRVSLLDGHGRYCGEPPARDCIKCVKRNGMELSETISVPQLRLRSARWLAQARRVIAPSYDTATRIKRHFPTTHPVVRPPEEVGPLPEYRTAFSKVARVVLFGAIGPQKGYAVLLECARDAARRRLPLEFVVIGYTDNDQRLMRTGKVFVTGAYGEEEVPHLIRREQPQIAMFVSVSPETWCYALTHAMRAGLPIVALDIGALAERLEAAGVGTLLPLDASASHINNRLLEIATGDAGRRRGPLDFRQSLSQEAPTEMLPN